MHNCWGHTKNCLDWLWQYTHNPEVIVVDNGSTDETEEMLDAYQPRSTLHPDSLRLRYLRSEKNHGFAHAINRGLKKATGDPVVLLNNDVLVTPLWLELLQMHLKDDVGVAGPMTNCAPPPQYEVPGYASPDGLLAYAKGRRQKFHNRPLEVDRVTGFCMAISRDALKAAGGKLSEKYGIGFFEDDDFCLRVRKAGYRCVVATGAYVHHHGSQTFKELRIDIDKQLRENYETFQHVWPEESKAWKFPAST